jgi:hypothetical protein
MHTQYQAHTWLHTTMLPMPLSRPAEPLSPHDCSFHNHSTLAPRSAAHQAAAAACRCCLDAAACCCWLQLLLRWSTCPCPCRWSASHSAGGSNTSAMSAPTVHGHNPSWHVNISSEYGCHRCHSAMITQDRCPLLQTTCSCFCLQLIRAQVNIPCQ